MQQQQKNTRIVQSTDNKYNVALAPCFLEGLGPGCVELITNYACKA